MAPPADASAITPAPAASTPAERASSADDDLADILARLDADSSANPSNTAVPSTSPAPGVGDELTDPRDLARPSSASGIVVEVGAGLEFDPTLASFGQRAVSAIIDTLVVTLAALPGAVILLVSDGVAGALLALVVAVLGLLAVIVLGARALSTSGKWIGNRVAGTTVVDAINGSYVDQGRGALRMFGRHLISPIFLFGYLMAFVDTQRRTFHDQLAQTVVTRRTREVWTADDD